VATEYDTGTMLISRCGLWIIAVSTIILIVYAGVDPNNDPHYPIEENAVPEYPYQGVIILSILVLVEAFIASFVIGAYRPSLRLLRIVMVSGFFVIWSMFWFLAVMHAPVFFMVHHVWVLLLTVLLLATGVVEVVRALFRRMRESGKNHPTT
jgi:hypothetical protein